MRKSAIHLNQFRVREGAWASNNAMGFCGAFLIPLHTGKQATVLSTDGQGIIPVWEHVSVSLNVPRCPTWEEMCQIKRMFWDEDELVIQMHPAASDYVNQHPHCLHLWRPVSEPMPAPPPEFVGLK